MNVFTFYQIISMCDCLMYRNDSEQTTMKRQRSIPKSLLPSSTPPSPQTLLHEKTTALHSKLSPLSISSSDKPRSRRKLHLSLEEEERQQSLKWVPLKLSRVELSLPLTFPTGQTFRWKQTGHLQYTGVVGSHLISLKHLDTGDDFDCNVAYCLHNANSSSSGDDDVECVLCDFLNVGICLSDLWDHFKAADVRFAELAGQLGGGARVLKQQPLECLIQFLCSSNNNIGRITRMVDYLSSMGNHLGNVGGFNFYEFPSLERLSLVSERELREAGFGYRAKYVTGTVEALRVKPDGGLKWLASLRKLELPEVIAALSTLPGVGPKVAACIALFSLDQHHAIPVDTHVWKIATRHLIPELAGARLSPKHCGRVADAFVNKYGKYAGWAQTLLFIAELPSQKDKHSTKI